MQIRVLEGSLMGTVSASTARKICEKDGFWQME